MAEDKVYKFWICIEAGILVFVTVFTVFHIFTGSEVSKTPRFVSISSASVIFWCLALIVTTITYACRRNLPNEHIHNSYKRNRKVKKYYKKVFYQAGSNCAICLETKNSKKKSVVELMCKHSYHKRCISECFGRLDSRIMLNCPLCRQLLKPIHKRYEMGQSIDLTMETF